MRILPNVCYWSFSFPVPNLNYLVWESSRSPADEDDQNATTSPLCISSVTISKKESKYDRIPPAPNQYPKLSDSLGLRDSQANKMIEPRRLQLDAIFGASDEELSEISDLEVADRKVESIEVRKEGRVPSKRAESPFSIAKTEIAKIRPAGTMDGVKSSGVLEVTREVDDRQPKENVTFATSRLVPRSFHHQSYHVSPDKSTSDARPNRKSRRQVRKNIIVSMESNTGDTRFATSERMTSMFPVPPLRGGIDGGNSDSRIEATGASIPDAGTATSPGIYRTQEDLQIAPSLVSGECRCLQFRPSHIIQGYAIE